MASTIDKAKKGNPGAMRSLYKLTVQGLYDTAYGLCGNEDTAVKAVVSAYKSLFGGLSSSGIGTEEDFRREAARKTENFCRRKSGKGGGKETSQKAVAPPSGPVPESVDSAVREIIASAASPGEKKRGKVIPAVAGAVVAVCLIAAGIAAVVGSSDGGDPTLITKPVIDLDESLTYYADIEIADYGTVTVRLDQKTAPVTVSNFISLARSGFYDGLTFHRIIEGFMMQGGDPNGNGSGGSDRNIVGEFKLNGHDNDISHTRGVISMARAKSYDSASSQFFIVQKDSPHLDGGYAAFGYVTEGMEVVDAVCEAAKPIDSNGTISPEEQPVITSVTIRTE